ncbi:gluconolactonase family protein [Chthonomonas calidirosea]|uniref:SMP-30/gluconolactonase/LRE family protein n=1 Tax=Chthonomonas calidirosea TaxID=454171 RepID=UPI0006DD4FAC|nr:SMP-30/gluconolactonase/LRE family protein [Chthonomonas calidirosea]CEK16584.1 gluconolactonase family protein [Chthonomonas calidirosea]
MKFALRYLLFVLPTFALVGCGGSSSSPVSNPPTRNTIASLQHITTVSSTVDPTNGDQNPYAIAFAPTSFTGDGNPAHVQPGDLIVSNFSNASGVNGAGTTVEAIRNGKPVTVYNEMNAPTASGGTVSTAGPVAIAFAPNGNMWIANYGLSGTGNDGNVQIVTPKGIVNQTFTDPRVVAGWGQAFNGGYGGKLAFFTVNVNAGTVVRINISIVNGKPSFSFDQITPDLGHSGNNASNIVGPQGMVHTADDTLYVADGATNSIIAIPNSTTTGMTTGRVVYQGSPLNQPAGMTLNPLNGDLIVANQKDNNLIELTPSGQVVAVKPVDLTPVNPITGAGSALFGVVATTDSNGNLVVYFTNDNQNTVEKLSQ